MKKKTYYLLLVVYVIAATATGFLWYNTFLYWLVAAGIFVMLFWNRDVIVKSESKPIQQSQNNDMSFSMTQDEYEQYVVDHYPLTNDEEKQGYITLARLCTSTETQEDLIPFFEELRDYSEDEDYGTTLNYVMEYLDKNDYHFIAALDWKQDIETLEWRLDFAVKTNYDMELKFPKATDYEKRASVSFPNVFSDFNRVLVEKGLQIGFIDTESDEYVIFVHRISDLQAVKNAVYQIGYNYFDVTAIQ